MDRREFLGAAAAAAPTYSQVIHRLADGHMLISMLGAAEGRGPGGFLLLDGNFDVAGRWERDASGMNDN